MYINKSKFYYYSYILILYCEILKCIVNSLSFLMHGIHIMKNIMMLKKIYPYGVEKRLLYTYTAKCLK